MAALEAYSPCPCGSGQKYKWCCQKAEPFVERAQRLADTNQVEASLAALDEGLAKLPGNPWLTMRKAVLIARQGKLAEAGTILRDMIAKLPDHVGAHNFLVRVVLETEGSEAGVAQFQQALSAVPRDLQQPLAMTAQLVGLILSEQGHVPSATAHLELSQKIGGDIEDRQVSQSLRMIDSNPSLSPWLKNPYRLKPAPEGLPDEDARTFQNALEWAASGLWSAAAAGFETLSANGVAVADYNLGLCRLWLTEDQNAASALRRYIASLGDSTEAVDLEALCQIIAPPKTKDLVSHVQLTWTVRDRKALLDALRKDRSVGDEGRGPIDPEDPDSPEVDHFALLDRPRPEGEFSRLGVQEVPRIEARVSVSENSASLDLVDDGRLERLSSQFTAIAGTALPPAHPRTKVLGPISRLSVALNAEIWLPPGCSAEDDARLARQERARILTEVWPDTRMPYLNGQTPREAGRDPALHIALRASLCQFEAGPEAWDSKIDFSAIRRQIGLEDEPTIDPATVEIERVHLSRLIRIPIEGLSDENLVGLFARAHHYAMPQAIHRSASALVERPQIFESGQLDRVIPYADLANLAISRLDKEEAFSWLERGRQSDRLPSNAVRWDFLELRLRLRGEKPEVWVPQLAVILDRYSQDRVAWSHVMLNLVEMGLMEVAPHPDEPDKVQIDSRRLQAILAQFGPKITTASGRLGVSATQGKIWTPGDAGAGGGGGVWTPGSGAKPPTEGGERPKLIIPGR